MIEAGEDPRFIARRLMIHASEDIGMADPTALPSGVAAAQVVQLVGLPEARIALAQATIHLATAPKSNAVITAIDAAMADVREGKAGSVPPPLRDGHYPGAAKLGNAQTYVYPHDRPGAVVRQQYPPDELVGRDYYQPTGYGAERALAERVPKLRRTIRGEEPPAETRSQRPMHAVTAEQSGVSQERCRRSRSGQTGGPEVLEYVEIDVPEPGPGEVAVQVGAAGVNFIDIYHRQGVYPMPLPFVPGREGAGRVIAIGSGRRPSVAVGDRVAWLQVPALLRRGQVVGPAEKLIPVPDGMSDEQAAALALQGLTAQSLATDVYRIESGDTVLIHAGAGGVGLLLTQIAKIKGAGVITTVSTPDKADAVPRGRRRRGADRLRRIPATAGISPTAEGVVGGVRRGRQGDLRRLAGRASGPRHPGAVRRGQRPGAAVRHPTAEQGRFTETDPAERRSLRPRPGRTAGQGQGCVRLGRRRFAHRADRRHLPAGAGRAGAGGSGRPAHHRKVAAAAVMRAAVIASPWPLGASNPNTRSSVHSPLMKVCERSRPSDGSRPARAGGRMRRSGHRTRPRSCAAQRR